MRKLCKQHLALFLNIHRWKEKKSNHTILCTWEKWGNQKRWKLLKIPLVPQLTQDRVYPSHLGSGDVKIVLCLRAKEIETRNSSWAFCGAAAGLALDAGCTEDSCWKHLCPRSSSVTTIQWILAWSIRSPWSLLLKCSFSSEEELFRGLLPVLLFSSL